MLYYGGNYFWCVFSWLTSVSQGVSSTKEDSLRIKLAAKRTDNHYKWHSKMNSLKMLSDLSEHETYSQMSLIQADKGG
jgi:hypothetical protein